MLETTLKVLSYVGCKMTEGLGLLLKFIFRVIIEGIIEGIFSLLFS